MTFLKSIGLGSSPSVQPSTVPPEPNGKKKGDDIKKTTHVRCYVGDRTVLNYIAKERMIPIHSLVHELTILAFKQHTIKDQVTPKMPTEFKKLFGFFDDIELSLFKQKIKGDDDNDKPQ
jgi:hypothetical protein